jgi:GNAT superfamily N-acetyltransferase
MTTLQFRTATPDDIAFIVRLIAEDSVLDPIDDPARAGDDAYGSAFAAIADNPDHMLMIAEAKGAPVGTFQLSFLPGIARRGMWRAQIEGVHVAPEHRSRGYGGQMMQWAIDKARERGCAIVQLTSNAKRQDAHRFYTRLGFVPSHTGFKLDI